MVDKLEETVHAIKIPGRSHPEIYALTHNRFNIYIVLFFSDLNKAQTFKMPCKVSSHDEFEIFMSFNCLHVFTPNKHTQDYHSRKPNEENFLFEIEDKKYIYVREKVISFETNDIIVQFSSEHNFHDIKFPYAYGEENIYFMLHRKYIPIQE